MKMFVLCLAIILTATIISLANSESVQHLEIQGIFNNNNINLPTAEKIFHMGQDHKVHIDFKAVKEKLVKIQVEKEGTIILKDAVGDLSQNVIYEINLKKYGKGEYSISLTTSFQKKIIETFKVQ